MNRTSTWRTLDSGTLALLVAAIAAFALVWSARWMALLQLSAGNAPVGIWAGYLIVAGALFGWGAYRLAAGRGRPDNVTWWLLAAPLTLFASPLAAGIWLAYLIVERGGVRRVTPSA